jgi:dihydroneopterin triphosphate diphosphatase
MAAVAEFRRPESVLIVVHTPTLDCLLLERVEPRGFWQSVTGTLRWAETPAECAARELAEETGLSPSGLRDAGVQRSFPILPAWRSRYAPGVDSNVEHRWYLEVPEVRAVRIEPAEHVAYLWLPLAGAIEKVASSTNREALEQLQVSRHP